MKSKNVVKKMKQQQQRRRRERGDIASDEEDALDAVGDDDEDDYGFDAEDGVKKVVRRSKSLAATAPGNVGGTSSSSKLANSRSRTPKPAPVVLHGKGKKPPVPTVASLAADKRASDSTKNKAAQDAQRRASQQGGANLSQSQAVVDAKHGTQAQQRRGSLQDQPETWQHAPAHGRAPGGHHGHDNDPGKLFTVLVPSPSPDLIANLTNVMRIVLCVFPICM